MVCSVQEEGMYLYTALGHRATLVDLTRAHVMDKLDVFLSLI